MVDALSYIPRLLPNPDDSPDQFDMKPRTRSYVKYEPTSGDNLSIGLPFESVEAELLAQDEEDDIYAVLEDDRPNHW